MLFKLHKGARLAVAVCDSNLFGKIYKKDGLQLDLTGKFFQGEEKTPEEIKDLFAFYRMEDACFNIVGKQSCEIAVQENLVSQQDVGEIDGIPFALILG